MPDPPRPTARSAGTRRIGSFLGADTANEIIAAEAPTPEGGWSAYPPHKHDETNEAEIELEDIYHFRVDGESGFGSFSCCSTGGEIDDTPRVSDCDVYRVPRGFHGPAAADPRHVMCHLDVLAGPSPARARDSARNPGTRGSATPRSHFRRIYVSRRPAPDLLEALGGVKERCVCSLIPSNAGARRRFDGCVAS